MAIWQFDSCLIPKKSIINKYGYIPPQLYIDHKGWENYSKSSNLDEKYDFEDALSIYWWIDLDISTDAFFLEVKDIGLLEEWTERYNGVAYFGDVDSNNMTVCYDEVSRQVQELSCRIDLRFIDKVFVNNILLIAMKFNCLFMDKQGRLGEPILNDLVEIMKKSNSYRFVSGPEQFLNDISTGAIKPE